MKDNFDLRQFLVENRMTEQSRGQVRKHFGKGLLTEGCGTELEEKKAGKMKPWMYDIASVYPTEAPVMEENEEDIYDDVELDDEDFVDPEDLPMEECDKMPGLADIAIGEGVGRADIHWQRPSSDDEMVGPISTEALKRKMFTRLGIDQESFNKFATQALGKVHGNVEKMYKIICQAYQITPKQARFLVDKGVTNWKTAGLGSKVSPTIREDFTDIANKLARQQDQYGDEEPEEETPAPDVFGGLGSTSYEAPEDFGEYDEESIRKSYTSLKNQGISDERAMAILAKQYDIPEETIRAMFRTELGNIKQKAVQVDEPKEKVSTFRMPKRSSAAEKAAAADIAGEFGDEDEDEDEFAKPGETDDEEETAASTEGATGTVKVPHEGQELEFVVPDNVEMIETEPQLIKRLQGYNRPPIAVNYLKRRLGAAQKMAAELGSGKLYFYLCADGDYHTWRTKIGTGDKITVRKKTGNEYETPVTQFVAVIDCSGAPVHTTRKAAADAAKTAAQIGTATTGYGSLELDDEEINNYVHSKVWNAKSDDQKLKDEYFPWSDEASEYMEPDEIEVAKAELKNETPVDPESEWAKAFAARR